MYAKGRIGSEVNSEPRPLRTQIFWHIKQLPSGALVVDEQDNQIAEIDEVNRQFIVEAVNAHNALVAERQQLRAALTELLDASHDNPDPMHKHWVERCKANARVALNIAKEGQPI